MNAAILCVGEILWDSLPNGLFLGGAPFNVAYHLKSLGADAMMVSSVGRDVLGRIIRQRIREKGLSTEYLQTEPDVPTGLVNVSLDGQGAPTFEIVAPAAWDMIRMTPDLAVTASSASALVFGSLAQRSELSAATIRQLLAISRLNVFDVNLRPPFDSKAVVQESLARSQIVKLNDQELLRLAGWFALPREMKAAAAALAGQFGPRMVCITQGPNGAALWNDGWWTRHPGFRVQVRDTVGAGDAFLASLLKGYLEGWGDEQMLRSANAHGAYVASKDGATPRLDMEELHAIESSSAG